MDFDFDTVGLSSNRPRKPPSVQDRRTSCMPLPAGTTVRSLAGTTWSASPRAFSFMRVTDTSSKPCGMMTAISRTLPPLSLLPMISMRVVTKPPGVTVALRVTCLYREALQIQPPASPSLTFPAADSPMPGMRDPKSGRTGLTWAVAGEATPTAMAAAMVAAAAARVNFFMVAPVSGGSASAGLLCDAHRTAIWRLSWKNRSSASPSRWSRRSCCRRPAGPGCR